MSSSASPASRSAVARRKARSAAIRARRALHRGAAKLHEATAEPAKPQKAPKSEPWRTPGMRPIQRLSAAEALRENGFTIYRNLFSADEVAELSARFKREAGITEGKIFKKTDAVNQFATSRDILFDDRVQLAVRTAIGAEARFLQLSDLHYYSDTSVWHRDSVHRGKDDSDSPDWNTLGGEPYKVVKAILYLEAENSAMGVMPASHLSPREIDLPKVKAQEARGESVVIDDDVEPNQRFTPEQLGLPFAWKSNPGDLLVFDQRLYHRGTRVENGRLELGKEALESPKMTLSLLLGADNKHSTRMYSFFRYARPELSYQDMPEELRSELAQRNLVLSDGWDNYYLDAPEELRKAYSRDPSKTEGLIEQFKAEAAARATA